MNVVRRSDLRVAYDRAGVVERRLQLFNEFALPLLRYGRATLAGDSFASSYAKSRLSHRPRILVHEPPVSVKTPVGVVGLRFSMLHPKVNDLWFFVYVSGQESRKRPSQVESMTRTMRRVMSRTLRGEHTGREVVTALLAPKGATRGAYRELRKLKWLVATSAEDLKKFIVRWLSERRWMKLWRTLRGKRVYGELALVMMLLAEVLSALGLDIVSGSTLLSLLEASLGRRPLQITDDTPPPPLPSDPLSGGGGEETGDGLGWRTHEHVEVEWENPDPSIEVVDDTVERL